MVKSDIQEMRKMLKLKVSFTLSERSMIGFFLKRGKVKYAFMCQNVLL
jgi:hypothetical protein